MLKKIYTLFGRFATHPLSSFLLAFLAFVESSLCPIFPDILLVPMLLKNPEKALRYTLICIFFSVLGGFLGYAIGYWLFESVGKPLLLFYHAERTLTALEGFFQRFGYAALMLGALTPIIPYKVIAIASGIIKMPLILFLLVSLIGRSLRFFIVMFLARFCRSFLIKFMQKRGMVWG